MKDRNENRDKEYNGIIQRNHNSESASKLLITWCICTVEGGEKC